MNAGNNRSKKRKIITIIIVAVLSILISLIKINSLNLLASQQTPKPLKMGEEVFNRECSVCHGLQGKGDGKAAYLLFPKPRDLTKGEFKVRSTPTGEPPIDQDLFNTITNGLPGSAMPSFISFSEKDRWDLVSYIKELGKINTKPERIIQIPPEPRLTSDSIALGRELYKKMKCWDCHGMEGKGDGPSVKTLKDSSGYPAPPNNFTRGIYKGGGKNSDIYLRFTTGMDGTPMPSYEDSMSEKDRWSLVHYIRSLAGPKVAVQPGTGTIHAKKISGPIPKDPFAKIWNEGPEIKIPLMLLWQRDNAIDSVSVRALNNGEEIGIMLTWENFEQAFRFIRTQDFSDGAAIMFSLSQGEEGTPLPLFTMGDKNSPTNLWYWRADRQRDISRFQDMEDVYSGMASDDYQLAIGWYPKGTDKHYFYPIVSSPAHNSTYITGWGAGNLVSNPFQPLVVEDLNAEGFGTLTTQDNKDQNVTGYGFWVAGSWRVIFLRSLNSQSPLDVKFRPGVKIPIGFAIWDGSKGDRDGQKSVTTWYSLLLEDKK